jgi:hypothetical protein
VATGRGVVAFVGVADETAVEVDVDVDVNVGGTDVAAGGG